MSDIEKENFLNEIRDESTPNIFRNTGQEAPS